MKKHEQIAAIVVTYNRKELLMQCLLHLLAQEGAECDILVVDNASTDGTCESVAALRQERIRYRNTGENLGGAGGFSFGVRWAMEAGYEYLWLMDDDTLPHPDALRQLWSAHCRLNGRYGFLAGAVLWKDGTPCRMNLPKVTADCREDLDKLDEGLLAVSQATFVSLFVPAAVVEKAGLPIRQFFIWGDDVEFTRRIAVRLGYRCYLAGRSRVTHLMETNTGSSIADDRPERIARYRLAYRNEGYTYRQEGLRGRMYYLAKCALNLGRIWLRAPGARLRRTGALTGGMLSSLFFRPRVEYVRRTPPNP